MSLVNKRLKDYKFGFSNSKKKFGINYWRFFFNGIDVISNAEHTFFLEFQMINPWLSPNETKLSFKANPKLTERDLQYALAGTDSAKELKTEGEIVPSYCLVRIGKLGHTPKQLCSYFPVKDIVFSHKPFRMQIGNILFSENALIGDISLSEKDDTYKLEYLCDQGYASWKLAFEVKYGFSVGYKDEGRWFPSGLKTYLSGTLNFDGVEYKVEKESCRGYSEKFWGKTLPEPWFHISATTLTSEITGKPLFNSAFAVQGIFNDKMAFVGKFEDKEIIFKGDKSSSKVDMAWNCTQMPETDNIEKNLLHWSCSFSSKEWIVDVDVYCKLKNLYNREIEMPDGARKTLNMIDGISESGEIKLYKQKGPNIEQIEHAKIDKVICEFGHKEELEF